LNDPFDPVPPAPRERRAAVRLPVLPPPLALLEIAVLFAVLVLIDWLFPAMELADFRPHPFWLPVLLLSLQYGTVSGLVAASVAILLRAGTGFPEQGPSETYFTYLLKIWIEPILWIAAAVILGQFRLRQINQKQQLLFQLSELESQRATLGDYAHNLRTHCTALERQLAGRSEPDIQQVLAALDLASIPAPALAESFARVINQALPGASASLYLADPTGLRLTARSAAGDDPRCRPWIGPTDPLFRAIAGDGAGVSVLSVEGEQRLAGHGLAAVPVFAVPVTGSSSDRRVLGMLKLEGIDPSALQATILPALATLARAYAPALQVLLDRSGHSAVVAAMVTPVGTSVPPRWRHLRWFAGRRQPEPANEQTAPHATRVAN
jgi:polysaccharide biosynthesis protein PelD